MVNTWPGWQNAGLLGEGSFGKVYKIQREEFGQTYEAALKVITIPASQGDVRAAYEEGMDEESVTEYFRGFVEDIVAEFALMSKLKGNSNIVSYEDHMVVQHEGEVGWDILIRMELLMALPDYIVRHPLEEADVMRLGLDLALALQICRKRGIIHRDIKPENIFVSKDGDFKLGDFGVARIAEKTISVMSRKGTYNYMAPEVYKGQEYGYTADIYSLGLVLYRFLNDNRVPFLPPYPQKIQYSDREGALKERMSGRQVPPPAHGSRELAEIVLKCCAFRSQDRYQDAGQLETDLRRLVPGSAASASVETACKRSRNAGREIVEDDRTVGVWQESRQGITGAGWEESGQGITGAGWEESRQRTTGAGWDAVQGGKEKADARDENTGTGTFRGRAVYTTRKPAGKQLFAMMLPFVLGGLCWQVYNVVDMRMAEPYGFEMSAAVSSAISLACLLGSLLAGVVTGGSTILARCHDARDGKGILDSARTMLVMAGIAGGVAALLGIFIAPIMLQGMGTSPGRMSYAVIYLRILSLGFLPAAIFYRGVGILQILCGGWWPLLLTASGAVLKVILNVIYMTMVRNGSWTIQQALAGSTVAVWLAGAVAACIAVHWVIKEYRVTDGKGQFARGQVKAMVLAGLPEGVMWALISFFWILWNTGISYYKIDMSGFAVMPIVGMSLAMNRYVRQHAGNLESGQLRRNVRTGCVMGAGIISALWVAILLVNPVMTWAGVLFLLLEYSLLAVAGCLIGALRGAGLSVGPVIIGLICWGVLRVCWAVAAPAYFIHDVVSRGDDIIWILGAVVFILYAWKVDWPDRARKLWGGDKPVSRDHVTARIDTKRPVQ